MPFSYDMCNVKLQPYANGLDFATGGWGKHYSRTFSISNMLNKKTEFSNHIFNWYLSNKKNTFAYNSRTEPAIFFIKKSISLKPFFCHFYEQSIIKTVQGPFYHGIIQYSRRQTPFLTTLGQGQLQLPLQQI